jgi:hypothetical protein
MTAVRIDESLWSGAMSPQAVLLQWAAPDGLHVAKGAHIAEVMVEGCRHEIMAPASGLLRHEVEPLYVLEPGDSIGRIEPG